MKTKLLLILLATGIGLISCSKYPPSSSRLTEDLAIYTKYDVSCDFTKFKTYYMSDSLVKVSDKDSGWVYNSEVNTVTSRIAQNMTWLGYTRTWNAKTADLYVGVSYIYNINVSVYYPGWYWGYYPYDYWGGYYPYYPYYPTYVTSYAVGTLLMDILDVQNPVDKKYPVRWNGYIRALLTGGHSTAQIEASIDQAFTQTKGFPKH